MDLPDYIPAALSAAFATSSVGTPGVAPRVESLTTVTKVTASVVGGRQLTLLMPSTQENASGHGFNRQSS